MGNRTWASARLHAADYAAHKDAIEEIFEDSAAAAEDASVSFNVGDIMPYQVWEPLMELRIPFTGMHGSHTGDYDAYAFAFDGSRLEEHPCDEAGNLSVPGLLETASLTPEALRFIGFHRKVTERITGKPAPDSSETLSLWSLLLGVAKDRAATANQLAPETFDDKDHEATWIQRRDLADDVIETASGIPDPYVRLQAAESRIADLEQFIGTIACMKKEGESYDDDGNLVPPGTPGATEHEPPSTDDEIDALYSLIHQARELLP